MTKIGVGLTFLNKANTPIVDFVSSVRFLEDRGVESVWLNEDTGRDASVLLGYLASATERIRLATQIMNVYTRTPTQIAMAAATLAELSDGRFTLGLGTGHETVINDGHGLPLEMPVERMEEYVRIIRLALTKRPFSIEGRLFKFRDAAPTYDLPRSRLQIIVAAHRPRMLRLAGAMADGVLINTPSLRSIGGWVSETIREGRRDGDGSEGTGEFEIACSIPCNVSEDGEEARLAVKKTIARYVGGHERSLKSARAGIAWALVRSGFEEEVKAVMKAAEDLGSPDKAAESVPDVLVDECSVSGTPSEARNSLARWKKTGATVILKPGILTSSTALSTVRPIAEILD